VAIAYWLWRTLLAILSLIGVAVLVVLIRWMRCRLRQRHYQQGISRAADAQQLLRVLASHWKLKPDIPLAHQASGLPIQAELIALEGLLFSDHILHGTAFKAIRGQLLTRDYRQVC
jgi:hypothetical protein